MQILFSHHDLPWIKKSKKTDKTAGISAWKGGVRRLSFCHTFEYYCENMKIWQYSTYGLPTTDTAAATQPQYPVPGYPGYPGTRIPVPGWLLRRKTDKQANRCNNVLEPGKRSQNICTGNREKIKILRARKNQIACNMDAHAFKCICSFWECCYTANILKPGLKFGEKDGG